MRLQTNGDRRTITVNGADPAGAMYGGLDIAEAIRLGTLDTLQDSDHSPHIAQRGLKFNIPLDKRQPSFDDNGTSGQENFQHAYRRTPTVFELEHYGKVKQLGNWEVRPASAAFQFGRGKTGPDFFRGALELLHATYLGYHGDAREWLSDNPALTRELLNRCGYWLFPLSLGLPSTLVAGTAAPFRLTIDNRGVAPPYQPYELRVRLSGGGRSWVGVVGRTDKSWLPGGPIVVQDQLTLPADLKSGRYAVSLGLFDSSSGKDRPVEMALQVTRRETDGYYRVTEVEVSSVAKPQR